MFRRIVILSGIVLALTVSTPAPVPAQTVTDNDGTVLKQIIIFGRHSVRSATASPETLAKYAVDPYPAFEVKPGCLTPHGQSAEVLLGAYFRSYLLYEGLLTGNDHKDAVHSYFRSNSIERSWLTAVAFGTGLIPNLGVPVHSYAINQPDPVFNPIAANVASFDPDAAATQVQEMQNSGTALMSAYSGEYSLIRSTLFDYPQGTQSPPPTPACCTDPTAQAIPLTANPTPQDVGEVIDAGGLAATNEAADPFIMQYADDFPLRDVAWGRLTLDQISQQTRVINDLFSIEVYPPYLNQVQSSNAASHVLRTMQQAVTGSNIPGAFGDARSRTVVIISSDTYVAGLAGILNLHWQLPGYQPDYCAPGGALVFELRQSIKTKGYLVRIFYTAQTFDQLRNQTPLTLNQPPATIQLLIPGASKSETNFDANFGVFQNLLKSAIGHQYVQKPSQENPPDVLTNGMGDCGS